MHQPVTRSIKLRDYQEEAVQKLWDDLFSYSSALCAISTGGGKTEIMMALLKKALIVKPDLKVVVLVNKINLIDQTYKRFLGMFHEEQLSIFCGSKKLYDSDTSLVIASIQSIFNVDLGRIDVLILDEAHNIDQTSGRYFEFIEAYKKKNAKLKIVAFTATPFRATGYIYGEDKLFPHITYKKGLKELIEL